MGLAESERVAEMLRQVRNEVRGGASLSKALEAQAGVFSRFYVNMVRAGEAGGALADVLARLAEFMERSKELRESVKSALIYPTILLLVALASVVDPARRWWCPSSSRSSSRAARRCRSSRRWSSAPAPSCAATGGPSCWARGGRLPRLAAACATPEAKLAWDRRVLRLPVVGRPGGEGGDGAPRAHARHAPSQRRVARERALDRARDHGQHLDGRRASRRSAASSRPAAASPSP